MKEGNVLFNDALNTIYLRLYGVNHMVKDHSDSERGNPLSPHGLLFPISSKGSSSHRQDNTYHGLCYTSRGALAGTRNIQWSSKLEKQQQQQQNNKRKKYKTPQPPKKPHKNPHKTTTTPPPKNKPSTFWRSKKLSQCYWPSAFIFPFSFSIS